MKNIILAKKLSFNSTFYKIRRKDHKTERTNESRIITAGEWLGLFTCELLYSEDTNQTPWTPVSQCGWPSPFPSGNYSDYSYPYQVEVSTGTR